MSISSEALQVAWRRAFCARLREDGTASELMRHLKAELRWMDEPAQILVAFKREVHNILIVDDNPDTISLVQALFGQSALPSVIGGGRARGLGDRAEQGR